MARLGNKKAITMHLSDEMAEMIDKKRKEWGAVRYLDECVQPVQVVQPAYAEVLESLRAKLQARLAEIKANDLNR